ncbi:MAG: sensor histidine kinase [Acidimicrobiales bacterium]
MLAYILFGSLRSVGTKGGGLTDMVTADVPERRRRLRVLWSAVWLFVLLAPASEIWQGRDRPAAVAIVALIVFAGMYLALWWVASDTKVEWPVRLGLLGGLWGLGVATTLAFHGSWGFQLFFVSAALACALPRRYAIFGVVAVTGTDALLLAYSPSDMALGQVFGVLIVGIVVLWLMRMQELIRELNAAREEVARLAVADERVRFARDLHDLLGHTLSLIVVKSEVVRRLIEVDTEAAVRESRDIEMVSRQALAEVREAVVNYRDRSLNVELEGAKAALRAAGIEATIHHSADRLPDTVESLLGWTVREGVTNVVRHSNGHHCAIDLRQADGMAVLEIYDDGNAAGPTKPERVPVPVLAGREAASRSTNGLEAVDLGSEGASIPAADQTADPARRPGTGLRGLAERLASAHGRLEAGRRPEGGFCLAVTVPLDGDGHDSV